MSTTPQPLSASDFAAKVRAKYPGAYDHLSDIQLVGKIVEKHPEYKDKIASYAPTQFEKDRPGTGANLTGAGTALWEQAKSLPESALKMLDPTQPFRHPEEMPIARAAHEAKAGWERGAAHPGSWPGVKGASAVEESLGSGFESLLG